MDTRVAVISIIVENPAAIEELNHYLHEAGEYIIGRMGIPYREKGINIISIAIDAPQDMISALSWKIGRLNGVSTKTAYSNVLRKRRKKRNEKDSSVRKRRDRKIHNCIQSCGGTCRKRIQGHADRL